MIFSTKYKKIPSGTNLSLFPTSANEFDLYLFKNELQKKKLVYSNILKCQNDNQKYNYNSVIKLSDNYLCVALENNMSVVKNNEKQ